MAIGLPFRKRATLFKRKRKTKQMQSCVAQLVRAEELSVNPRSDRAEPFSTESRTSRQGGSVALLASSMTCAEGNPTSEREHGPQRCDVEPEAWAEGQRWVGSSTSSLGFHRELQRSACAGVHTNGQKQRRVSSAVSWKHPREWLWCVPRSRVVS